MENSLCVRDADGAVQRDQAGEPVLECMCGNVIFGRFDPSKPFFTPGGSFWANDTTRLLATTTDSDRQARTRNRCNGEGYESVALTAHAMKGDEARCLAAGMDAYLSKPVNVGDLFAVIERLAGSPDSR